jgi:hypothetical protein
VSRLAIHNFLSCHPKGEARMGSLTDCRRCFAAGNDEVWQFSTVFFN